MISREAVERLFDQHNHQYPSARAWREALIDDLLALVPTPSREGLEKIWDEEYAKVQAVICTDQRTYYMEPVDRQELGDLHRKWRRHIADRLMAWARGDGERLTWCRHLHYRNMREDEHGRPSGWYATNKAWCFFYAKDFKFCPLCAAPRPQEPS